MISWIKGKRVAHIVSVNHEFMFICHSEYDDDLDIESSILEDFAIALPEKIAPGILTVLDVVQTDLDEQGFGSKLIIITRND